MTPTILIFLKTPVPGQAKTRLAAGVGEHQAIEIYQRLVHHQMAALPPDWPVEVHFTPAHEEPLMRAWVGEETNRRFFAQAEGALGERLIHASRAAFSRGAEAVILMGGDCPEIDATLLTAATDLLADRTAVMGPTYDGGYYLLGIARPEMAFFDHEDWGTPAVADRTRAIARRIGWKLAELQLLRDVDTAEDWDLLKHRLK